RAGRRGCGTGRRPDCRTANTGWARSSGRPIRTQSCSRTRSAGRSRTRAADQRLAERDLLAEVELGVEIEVVERSAAGVREHVALRVNDLEVGMRVEVFGEGFTLADQAHARCKPV